MKTYYHATPYENLASIMREVSVKDSMTVSI